MRTSPILPALALTTLLGACAPTTQWTREKSTPEQLRRDQEDCAAEGDRYRSILSGADREGSGRGAIYAQCMQARGWRRERPKQAG